MADRQALTGHERFLRMIERRDHDRVPRFDQWWPETLERWRTEGMDPSWADQEVLDWMEADVRWGDWVNHVPFPGQREIIEEDDETQLIRDAQGQVSRWWKNRYGTPEHVSFGCDTPEKWYETYKPALTSGHDGVDFNRAIQWIGDARKHKQFSPLCQPGPFEHIRQLIGDEMVLMSVLDEQEWIADMAKTYADLQMKTWQTIVDRGGNPDAIWVHDDIGFSNGPFFSTEVYRELFFPQHIRQCQFAHDHGWKFIFHTDGDVSSFLDMFVEGGFDVWQPIEAKAGMDIRKIIPAYGDKLSFWGNIDMSICSTNDKDQIREEVVSKLKAGMEGKCYAYHSDHSVPPDVSWETYQYIISLVIEHGNYE